MSVRLPGPVARHFSRPSSRRTVLAAGLGVLSIRSLTASARQDDSTQAPVSGEPRIDWLAVACALKEVAGANELLDFAGVQVAYDRQWAIQQGIFSEAFAEQLPDDWLGTLYQSLFSWAPDSAGGLNYDRTVTFSINLFGSEESAKAWRRLVRDAYEDIGAAALSEEEIDLRGFFLYQFDSALADNPGVPQHNLFGVYIGEGTSVLVVQGAGIGDAVLDVATMTALAAEFRGALRQTTARPLGDLLLFPEDQPGLSLTAETIDGRFYPIWGASDSDNDLSRHFAGESLFHYTAVLPFGQLDGNPFYSLQTGGQFVDPEQAQQWLEKAAETLTEIDSASESPPARTFLEPDLVSVYHNRELFDAVTADAFIYPVDATLQYVGAELAITKADRVATMALYRADAMTYANIDEWLESDEFRRFLEAEADILDVAKTAEKADLIGQLIREQGLMSLIKR